MTPMIAFIGVRSSWLMLARNCDLCRLATSSSLPLSWISWKSRAFSTAMAACDANVWQQVDGGRRDRVTAHPVVRGEDPDRATPRDHRDHQDVPRAQGGEGRVGRSEPQLWRQGMLVVEEQRRAVPARRGQRAGLPEGDRQAFQRLPFLGSEAGARAEREGVARWRERPHVQPVEPDHLPGRVEHARQLLAERERLLERGGEPVELVHVAGKALQLASLLLELTEEPRVLDGEGRLGGEGREKRATTSARELARAGCG